MTARPRRSRPQHVTAALFVDMGTYAHGRWVKRPRARYECGPCGYREQVEGPEAVTAFVAHIRITHRANCPALTELENAA